jgi:NAD(P)-dependent dehydrogenase (short-subunit alcohol dehydrogenase family)
MEIDWLTGRVAIVTGASRGIGRSTALALATAGARVVLGARSAGALEDAAAAIRAQGGDVRAVAADVADPHDVERLFAVAEAIDVPTVLVCAAGLLTRAPFEETTDGIWHRTLDVNLTGAFLCCRRAFSGMRRVGGGRIITIASLSGVYATEKFPGLVAYNVSKYGVVGLTEGIAVEGRAHRISAICLSPGAVDTEMLRLAAPGLKAGLAPDDVGRMIVALLNDAIAPASGANIPLFSNR